MAYTIAAAVLAILFVSYIFFASIPPEPTIDLTEWWGPESTKNNVSNEIKSFTVEFPESKIAYIKERLRNVRNFTPSLEGTAFEYGFNSKEIVSWLQYWAERYNFSDRAAFFNQYPHYKTNIQGLDIHYIRVTPEVKSGVDRVPLLVLHGWPSCVREYYEVVPYMTAASENRSFVVDLILPSLPGHGFSSAAVRSGCGVDKMAVIFRNLMQRIGFNKYYVQGDGFGGLIAKDIATLFPTEVLGCHTVSASLITPMVILNNLQTYTFPALSQGVLPAAFSGVLGRTGYFHEQATKPDTVGAVLIDSPPGIAAYLLERISTGARPADSNKTDGGLSNYNADRLLDIVFVYCITGTIATSMRLYAETFNFRYMNLQYDRIPTPVPAYMVQTGYELITTPSLSWRFKFPNLIDAPTLGEAAHLAFERPDLFSESVFGALTQFRTWHQNNN